MAGFGQGQDKMQKMPSDSDSDMAKDLFRWLDPTMIQTRCCDSFQSQIQTGLGCRRDGRPYPRIGMRY